MTTSVQRRNPGFIALLLVALLVAACGSANGTPAPPASAAPASIGPSESDSLAPSDSASGAVIPESPVAGIVVGVDSQGLDQVKGFTLRTNDGETLQFALGPLENADEFAPGHLKEHQTTAAPVLVFFRMVNDQLLVFRIEDAG